MERVQKATGLRAELKAAALALASLAGCYDPDLSHVAFACEPGGPPPQCPDGQACSPLSRLCVSGCAFDLSGVGAGDFAIKFKIATTAKATSTVACQRASCDASADFWDVQLDPSGAIKAYVLRAADAGRYAELATTVRVNDGRAHDVELRRSSGTLESYTDGAPSGSVPAPQELGALPALRIASGNPCEGLGGLHPLQGNMAGICLGRP